MRYLFCCAFVLISCSSVVEQIQGSNTAYVSPAMEECLAMKTLWQIECFCIEQDACEGRHYACFWDLADDGLGKNPEMADLYNIFYNDMIKCGENSVRLSDINPCEDAALAAALKRCEERLLRHEN